MKKRLLSLLLAAAMVLSLAACTGGQTGPDASPGQQTPKPNNEGVVVNVADCITLINLEVYKNNNSCNFLHSDLVFDPLYYGDRMGTNTPCICTSYDLNEDGTEATLHIREGVKFHDGTDLNAKDVVATFEFLLRGMDTLALASSAWSNLEKVEYIDDTTCKLYLSQYFATFETSLSYTWILSDEDIEQYGDDFQAAEKVINGSGPWKYVEWQDGQYCKYAVNKDYWNAEDISNIDTLYVWYVSEDNAKASGMISGDLDYVCALAPDMFPMVEGKEGIIAEEFVADIKNYIQFDCAEDSIFSDVNARKAVAHAIDRDTIIGLVGGGEKMNCLFLPSLPGYDETIPGYEYDPELAKQYLAKTDYAGQEITIYSRQDMSSIDDVMAVFVENLSAVGFNVKTKVCDSAEFVTIRQDPSQYDLFYINLGAFDGDPWTLDIIPRIVQDCHNSYYVNEELNALITASYAETDAAEREKMLKQVSNIVYEECGPQLALVADYEIDLVREGIEGINMTKCAGPYFRFIRVNEEIWGK